MRVLPAGRDPGAARDLLSLAAAGEFEAERPAPRTVGLLIGAVYRLRVTHIRLAEGLEVYPTIEVVDRLYAPPGQERRFAIPVDLTDEDLRLALDGKFVTRVIYLEDPRTALPVRVPASGRTGSTSCRARTRWRWPTDWAGRWHSAFGRPSAGPRPGSLLLFRFSAACELSAGPRVASARPRRLRLAPGRLGPGPSAPEIHDRQG